MATPPRVDPELATAALRAIAERRRAIDDPHQELLDDDPRDVLRYLRKYSGRDVPLAVRQADVEDALRLWLSLWWESAAIELWLLDRAEALNMNRRRVGAILGIQTGQGVVDRRDRLRAMLGEHGKPDEKVTRKARQAAQHPGEGLDSRQQRWLDRRRTVVLAVAATLVDHKDLADDDAYESLIDITTDLRNRTCTPASFTVLDWAVDAMATIPAVQALPERHPLARALRDWQALAGEYRRIGRADQQR